MKYRIPVKFVQAAAGAKMNFALRIVWPVQDFAATGKDFAVQTGARQTNYSPSVRAMLVHDPFRQGLPKSTYARYGFVVQSALRSSIRL